MDTNPRFTEAAIQGYIAEHRGTRFRADRLAGTFGAGASAMRETLEGLARQGKIRRTTGSGSHSEFYLPSQEELDKEARLLLARPFKPLSASNLPNRDYDSRRAGSADLLRVPSKHV
jgi:DNA-binding GntR family transcriptional regulator